MVGRALLTNKTTVRSCSRCYASVRSIKSILCLIKKKDLFEMERGVSKPNKLKTISWCPQELVVVEWTTNVSKCTERHLISSLDFFSSSFNNSRSTSGIK